MQALVTRISTRPIGSRAVFGPRVGNLCSFGHVGNDVIGPTAGALRISPGRSANSFFVEAGDERSAPHSAKAARHGLYPVPCCRP